MTDHNRKPSRQYRPFSILLIAAFCSLSAWGQDAPQDGVYKDRIDWGLLMDMSGPTSASQGVWVNGFRDYMRKINEAGGINGRKSMCWRRTTASILPLTKLLLKSW